MCINRKEECLNCIVLLDLIKKKRKKYKVKRENVDCRFDPPHLREIYSF